CSSWSRGWSPRTRCATDWLWNEVRRVRRRDVRAGGDMRAVLGVRTDAVRGANVRTGAQPGVARAGRRGPRPDRLRGHEPAGQGQWCRCRLAVADLRILAGRQVAALVRPPAPGA